MRTPVLIAALLFGFHCSASLAIDEDAPAVTARDLLAADAFPEAQMGMTVESAVDADIAKIVTTGAEFLIDKQQVTITCSQRLAQAREVAILRLPKGTLKDLKRTHHTTGAAIFSDGKNIARINGDSLLMISCAAAGAVTAELRFTPDYHSAYLGNFNFFDPVGGISFFEHGRQPSPQLAYWR